MNTSGNLSGLVIGDSHTDHSDATLTRLIKHLTVPPHRHQENTFVNGTAQQIQELEDPMRRQIVEAMQASGTAVQFASLEAAQDNVSFRLAAMDAMKNFNSGSYDADYFSESLKLQSSMGWFPNKAQTHGTFWSLMDPQDVYSAQFVQNSGTTPSQAMAPVSAQSLPFRGECAGAFQLAVYYGLLNGLGATRFNDLAQSFGTLYVGPWRINNAPNPSTLFMKSANLADSPIPGDYLYFKNKDDYSTLAPNGFWTGLNAMYMGFDATGTRHFSGLGASWLSEANLRIDVANAYYHDCYPHTIQQPDKECRFIIRNTLEIPAIGGTMIASATNPLSVSASMLSENGFLRQNQGHFARPHVSIGELNHLLGFEPESLKQIASAPRDNPPYKVPLPGGTLIVHYGRNDHHRTHPETIVSATVHLKNQ